MTLRIPKAALVVVGLLAAAALGVVATMLITGGDDTGGDRAAGGSPSDGLSSEEAFENYDQADTDLDNEISGFQDSLDACAVPDNAVAVKCFTKQFAPYRRALEETKDSLAAAIKSSNGVCAGALEKAELALVGHSAQAEMLKNSFVNFQFDVGGGDWVRSYTEYRKAYDDAFGAC